MTQNVIEAISDTELPALTAHAIAAATPTGSAPRFKRTFTLDAGHGDVVQATLRASALGVYEATLDGVPVSEDVLAPGWSSYEWRLLYQSYDVLAQLSADTGSEHVLAALVGNGWYLGHLGWQQLKEVYGSDRALIMQLDVVFADGHVQTIRTDDSWSCSGSEVLADDLYNGQTIDARPRDTPWVTVKTVDFPAELTKSIGPSVRRQDEVSPTKIWTSPAGKTLVDFGQNLVGWVRLRARGEAGSTITVRHAEVLEHEELGTRPLREAQATDRFILSGGEDIFEPTFTFHGFRFAEVTGFPGEVTAEHLTAVVVHSDMERTGHFRTSNALVNQLHSNVVWGLKGNFLDVPTDCPQRNERLGWTGDIAVFTAAATGLYNVKDFLAEWLQDLSVEQQAADGFVPFVVPDMLKYQQHLSEFPPAESAAIWSDAAVWVPWALWKAYGDAQILRDQYESMVSHVRRVESLVSETGLWDTGFQFGDWLDPDAAPDRPGDAKADAGVVATACLVRTARMVASAAQILGHEADAETFTALAQRTSAAFNDHYVESTGKVHSDCTTVYSLAIMFELLSDEHREFAGNRLAELVQESGHKISTGFAGTPYIAEALTSTGHVEDAYKLLLQTQCPSWLYPVTMGATTIWERWDSMLPDGTINPGDMTSFNHYALGSVADWLHRVVGGLQAAEPGYARVRIAPRPPVGEVAGDITWAETSLMTAHGLVFTRWELGESGLVIIVELPDGVEADLDVPGFAHRVLSAGRHEIQAG